MSPLHGRTRQPSDAALAALHAVFIQAPAAIAVLRGPEHRFELANPLYLRLVHREIVGQTIAEALPEVIGQGFIDLLDRVYTTGEPYYGVEIPVQLAQPEGGADLATVLLNFAYEPLRDDDGRVTGVFVIAFDVTENALARRRLEEAKRLAERSAAAESAARREAEAAASRSAFLVRAVERLSQGLHAETILQVMADVVVPELCDAASVRMPEPGGALRLMGAAPATLLRVGPSTSLGVADTVLPAAHPIHDVLARGAPRVVEDYEAWGAPYAPSLAYLRHLGEHGIRRVAFIPMVAHGKVVGVLSAAMGTSDRPLDADRVQLLVALGKHAALAIENARLYEEAQQLRRRAEEASVAKDQFIATVSHELRTPLNAILGWSQIIQGSQVDPAVLAKGVGTIERNARAQAQLVDDLLDVSRIAVGKLKIAPSTVLVPHAIEVALDSARPAAEAKGIRLETEVDPEVGSIIADPDRFQQVIWNLISNSVKFTPQGGVVRVSARRVDAHFEFSVADDGKGIPPDALPYVFDRFHQVEPGNRKTGGLGLGLAIVRNIVELHGGTVTAESGGLGKGARFTVRIPIRASLRPASRPGPESDPHDGGAIAPPPRLLHGLRVLVVDDDADARELLSAILSDAGASLRAAASVDEAIALLHVEIPDAIVSDIGMPGQDGYALIRHVRGLPRERGGRVAAVALTAHARSEDRTRALTAGFTTHIPKPVEPSELVIVVASALGREVHDSSVSPPWIAA